MKYVALLRGIGPTNPNMRGEKLRGVLEELGFNNVQTVITSGNVVFESSSKDIKQLQNTIEAAWPKHLGFNSTTIIRSQQQLQDLVAKNPFKGVNHSPKTYQLVTFFKNPIKTDIKFPFTPPGKGYTLLGKYDDAICSTLDTTAAKTPDLMVWLERQFGKEITSRTYKTIERILQKME
ncbi:DUF1697 domain-containing protein [Candidatus Saccharibacteria bacterium]|nr:DUF1697 domain-containing protein [Candidatus Saccharibacteria bacterium]